MVKNMQSIICMKIQTTFFRFCYLVCLVFYLSFLISPSVAKEGNKQVDRGVQVIERPAPKYPTLALMKKVEGWVKVKFTISEKGEILAPSIIEANPPDVFEYSAIEAVKKFKFNPPIKNGVPVAQIASQTLEFTLPKQSSNEIKKQISSSALLALPFVMNGSTDNAKAEMPDDVAMIIKSIQTKSKIKTHQRSLRELIVDILPDTNGRPAQGKIIKNTYGNALSETKIKEVIDGAIFRAQFTHDKLYGYYNPNFILTSAKNQPARVIPTFAAKSKPLPDLSFEFELNAKVTINQNGEVIEVKDSSVDGHEVKDEMVKKMLDTIHFFEASKRYKPIIDEVEITIAFALIQKPFM